MAVIPFQNLKSEGIYDENDLIKLDNTSNDLNELDGNFINTNLCEREEIKNNRNHRPSLLKNEITGLKLHKKNKVGKRIILGGGSSSEKAKFLYNHSNEHKRKGVDSAYKLMKAIATPSSRSDRSDYLKDNDYKVVPVIPNNNGGLVCNAGSVIIPYQKLQEFCNIIENKNHQKCRNFLIYSPDVIQKWIRVIFNIIITSLIITLIYFVFVSVREDINKKIAIQKQNIKEDSISCKKQYEAHKCATINLPMLSEKCDEWLKCMKADSNLYQDISFLSAQMLGQIINAFIVQFEWKSICVIAFIFLLIFIGSNYALSIGGGSRSNGDMHYSPPPPPPINSYPFYPNYSPVPNIYSPLGTINPMNYNRLYANIPTHSDHFVNSPDFTSTTASTNNIRYQPYYEEQFYEETPPNTSNSHRFIKRKGPHEYTEQKHASDANNDNSNNGRNNFAQKIFNLWGNSNKGKHIETKVYKK